MIIDCISDLHGYYPELEGGDLLIIVGDLTARDTKDELLEFHIWVNKQNYKKTIIIAGNHDNLIAKEGYPCFNRPWAIEGQVIPFNEVIYLCDSGTEFEGLKIWGCPYSLFFLGINSRCTAFTGTEEDLKKRYDLIPNDIDILVTHSPAYGILDKNYKGDHCGSRSLLDAIQRINPLLVVHGHIHEQGAKIKRVIL